MMKMAAVHPPLEDLTLSSLEEELFLRFRLPILPNIRRHPGRGFPHHYAFLWWLDCHS